ncbi:hypothetical protein HYU18_02570 [Candidatus Woesearchaeota archaeon]|nr:hypothetical protein [Candidatus Woesearchaeota archaeon]
MIASAYVRKGRLYVPATPLPSELYDPVMHIPSWGFLTEVRKRLAVLFKADFPAVRQFVFLQGDGIEQSEYGLDDSAPDGKYVLFKQHNISLPLGLYNSKGFSIPAEGSAFVMPSVCTGLVEVVNTALHEASHIQEGSDTCEVPNLVAKLRTQEFLTRVFV